jgi:hypothetical protein
LHGRQSEVKYRTARFIRFRLQPPPVTCDDGAAYRKPHPNSTYLCGVEGFEDSLNISRINARPRIPHLDEYAAVRVALLNADR